MAAGGVKASNPSPVLMIRSIPHGLTDKDLENWANSFAFGGGLTKCLKTLIIPDKAIAFVQMYDVEQAKLIMSACEYGQKVLLRGDTFPASIDFSTQPEIRAQSTSRNKIPTGETRMLLVVLKDLSNTIMIDDLFWIFSQFGLVEKLSSFSKNQKNQVLVQFQAKEDANRAMSYLNGRRLHYQTPDRSSERGSCSFAIVPSSLPELTFKTQDMKNRDYKLINERLQQGFHEFHNGYTNVFVDMMTKENWRIRDFLWGQLVMGNGELDPVQDKGSIGRIPETKTEGIPPGKVGDCVHLSKVATAEELEQLEDRSLPKVELDPRMLWRLCGIYGKILAVKKLHKYPGCFVLQFSDRTEASRCIEMLNGLPLWERHLAATESKNANAMHWAGANTDLEKQMCTFKDMEQPPRTTIESNFVKPSNYIYMWDIPEDVTKDALFELLETAVEVVERDGNTATIMFPTVEDAVVAVGRLNGEKVPFQVKMHFRRQQEESDLPHTKTELPNGNGSCADAIPHSFTM